MNASLLPTPGDWLALLVWVAFAATIAALLLVQRAERRREAAELEDPVAEFAELRRHLRPDRVVLSPEALERIRRTLPDATPVGTIGGVPVVVSRHVDPDQVFLLRTPVFDPPAPSFFADEDLP